MTVIAYIDGTSESDLTIARPGGGTWYDFVMAVSAAFKRKKKNAAALLYGPLIVIYYFPKDIAVLQVRRYELKCLVVGEQTSAGHIPRLPYLMHEITQLPYTDTDPVVYNRLINEIDIVNSAHSYSVNTEGFPDQDPPIPGFPEEEDETLIEESKYFFTHATLATGACTPFVATSGWHSNDSDSGDFIPPSFATFKITDSTFMFDLLDHLKATSHLSHIEAWRFVLYFKAIAFDTRIGLYGSFTLPSGTFHSANDNKIVMLVEEARSTIEGFFDLGRNVSRDAFFNSNSTGDVEEDGSLGYICYSLEGILRLALEDFPGTARAETKFESTVELLSGADSSQAVTFDLLGETASGQYSPSHAGYGGIRCIYSETLPTGSGWGPNDDPADLFRSINSYFDGYLFIIDSVERVTVYNEETEETDLTDDYILTGWITFTRFAGTPSEVFEKIIPNMLSTTATYHLVPNNILWSGDDFHDSKELPQRDGISIPLDTFAISGDSTQPDLMELTYDGPVVLGEAYSPEAHTFGDSSGNPIRYFDCDRYQWAYGINYTFSFTVTYTERTTGSVTITSSAHGSNYKFVHGNPRVSTWNMHKSLYGDVLVSELSEGGVDSGLYLLDTQPANFNALCAISETQTPVMILNSSGRAGSALDADDYGTASGDKYAGEYGGTAKSAHRDERYAGQTYSIDSHTSEILAATPVGNAYWTGFFAVLIRNLGLIYDGVAPQKWHRFYLLDSSYTILGTCTVVITSAIKQTLSDYAKGIIEVTEVCSRNNGTVVALSAADKTILQDSAALRATLDAYFTTEGNMTNDWMSYSMLAIAVGEVTANPTPVNNWVPFKYYYIYD